MRHSRWASREAVVALIAALVLAACGDDSGDAAADATGATSASSHSSAQGGGASSGAPSGAGAESSSSTSSTTPSTSAGDAAGSTGSQGAGGAATLCASCGVPSDAGIVASPAIAELSGLAASRLHEGILYAHNDSGDEPRFFALSLTGEDRGTFSLPAAAAVDWEEIAAGPCGDGAPGCLYLADFGDNDEVRDDLVLYRVPEPESVGEGLAVALEAEAFPFSYPDGPHNAEAFVVHPTTGVVTIFTKAATSRVFELTPPLEPGMVATAAGEIAFDSFLPLATGADIDAGATVLAIRTYADVLLFPIPAGGSARDALAQPSCAAPHAAEMQGEAIAFLTGGASYVTASEGAATELHRVDCP